MISVSVVYCLGPLRLELARAGFQRNVGVLLVYCETMYGDAM